MNTPNKRTGYLLENEKEIPPLLFSGNKFKKSSHLYPKQPRIENSYYVAQDISVYYSVLSTYCATLLLEITLLQSNNNFENVGQDISVYYSVWF